MRPVDKILAGYLTFITVVLIVRMEFSSPETWLLLAMHVLVGILLFLLTKLQSDNRVGGVLREIYPLLLLTSLYNELGIMAMQHDLSGTLARDMVIRTWEAAIFGDQISYDWIRQSPSIFWSGIFHLAYLAYYPIIMAGPVLLLMRGETLKARNVVFTTILAFLLCYVVFALYPVAGPNYTFEHPTGPVREVWSARLVYAMLGTGSAIGTAFPSSHVAATVAANFSLWREWRGLALIVLVPTVLLIIGTVYCQMHYGVDALAGLGFGLAAGWIGVLVARRQSSSSSANSKPPISIVELSR